MRAAFLLLLLLAIGAAMLLVATDAAAATAVNPSQDGALQRGPKAGSLRGRRAAAATASPGVSAGAGAGALKCDFKAFLKEFESLTEGNSSCVRLTQSPFGEIVAKIDCTQLDCLLDTMLLGSRHEKLRRECPGYKKHRSMERVNEAFKQIVRETLACDRCITDFVRLRFTEQWVAGQGCRPMLNETYITCQPECAQLIKTYVGQWMLLRKSCQAGGSHTDPTVLKVSKAAARKDGELSLAETHVAVCQLNCGQPYEGWYGTWKDALKRQCIVSPFSDLSMVNLTSASFILEPQCSEECAKLVTKVLEGFEEVPPQCRKGLAGKHFRDLGASISPANCSEAPSIGLFGSYELIGLVFLSYFLFRRFCLRKSGLDLLLPFQTKGKP